MPTESTRFPFAVRCLIDGRPGSIPGCPDPSPACYPIISVGWGRGIARKGSTMAADTTTSTNDSSVGVVNDNRATVHQAAVAEIVGMIRAKYEDEGVRNFAIGKRAFEHAQWQKGNFPG